MDTLKRDYEKNTGRQWGDAEQHMLEICDAFDYTITLPKNGCIILNMKGETEEYNGKSIYDFYGHSFSDKDKLIDHREYLSVEDMLSDWEDECTKVNENDTKEGRKKTFNWIN